MISFYKDADRYTILEFNLEINLESNKLEIESELNNKNGLGDNERHTMQISKEQAKPLYDYLNEWFNPKQEGK